MGLIARSGTATTACYEKKDARPIEIGRTPEEKICLIEEELFWVAWRT